MVKCAESQTLGDFGAALRLLRSDVEHLRSVFVAVHNGDMTVLTSLGIKESELGDVKFFLEKLIKTGFLDWLDWLVSDLISTSIIVSKESSKVLS